jgi:hypothetical protein
MSEILHVALRGYSPIATLRGCSEFHLLVIWSRAGGTAGTVETTGLARALKLARRGAGCRGASHAVDADVNTLVEFGRVVFRVALGDTRALCVRVFRFLRA